MDFSTIRPFQYVALRLPNDQTRIERLNPNSLIHLGKYGSFHTNQLFGRPYHLTFEILDRAESRGDKELRIVSATELHAAALLEEAEREDETTPSNEIDDYGLLTGNKSNVNITDDPTNQRLTMAEIEELKQDEMGSTKDLIAKIMQSHTALDQKTAFSLAKYTLRKHKKYMKRFTVLPLDVATLTDWMMAEKDFSKIMEIRNEITGLIGCWANIHASGITLPTASPSSRYLVVDDTGGLVVAAMAERMGILHQANPESKPQLSDDESEAEARAGAQAGTQETTSWATEPNKPTRQRYANSQMSATSNTLTVIHSNQQPNLSLLRYFNFDSNNPTASHPLHAHLKSLSWLQLLEPESDSAYQEPPALPSAELSKLKPNRRSNYFRKRRRWERTRGVVDTTRQGEFDGLVVASYTSPVSILQHLVPLLAGGAQVVVYSPNIEPLLELTDYYSTARRTAFLNRENTIHVHDQSSNSNNNGNNGNDGNDDNDDNDNDNSDYLSVRQQYVPSEDFPVDPTLLLAPMVQTSRVREWQVLPGRTHPVMTSKGGAEGYVWTATRVVRAAGKVSARGKGRKNVKNKVVKVEEPTAAAAATDGTDGTDDDDDDDVDANANGGQEEFTKRPRDANSKAGGFDGDEQEVKRVKIEGDDDDDAGGPD